MLLGETRSMELSDQEQIPRHALHSAEIAWVWNGSPVGWSCGLPRDMEEFLQTRE